MPIVYRRRRASFWTLRASAYHPRVLLKIGLLAYSRGVTSSRVIESLCRRDVQFMAVSGDLHPQFKTLRGQRNVDGQWKLYCLVHNIESWRRTDTGCISSRDKPSARPRTPGQRCHSCSPRCSLPRRHAPHQLSTPRYGFNMLIQKPVFLQRRYALHCQRCTSHQCDTSVPFTIRQLRQ